MVKVGRAVVPIGAAALVLTFAGWFDSDVLRRLQREAGTFFDPYRLTIGLSFGYLLVAGSILVLGGLVWRSRSALAGWVYIAVGAFLAFLPFITFRLAATSNDAPPVLPQPIAAAVSDIYSATLGLLNSVEMIGAGMLLAGVAVVAAPWIRRYSRRMAQDVAAPSVS